MSFNIDGAPGVEPSKPGLFASNEPGALGLDEILQKVSQDDQEEWEYEYSTTETETYYLTVELSYPEFKEHTTRTPHHSRGGYYKNWHDRETDTPSKGKRSSKKGKDADDSDDEDDNDDNENENEDNYDETAQVYDEDDDGPQIDPALREAGKEKEKATEPPLSAKAKGKQPERVADNDNGDDDQAEDKEDDADIEDIQILDLHSHNPIISYRGRVFEAKWAEVIGTEAILTAHDNENPLPALRNLPGGIDILGASSSRLLTTEKIPKPKVPEEDTLASIKDEWNIRIPVGKDRTGERAEQTKFLENLIALKKKKGHKDEVTVYATDGPGKDWDDKKGLDYQPRKKAAGTLGDDDDDDDGRGGRRRAKQRGFVRPRGRPRGNSRGRYASVGASGGLSHGGGHGLSTPTPGRWGDLSKESGGEEDEDEENNDSDEDVTMTG